MLNFTLIKENIRRQPELFNQYNLHNKPLDRGLFYLSEEDYFMQDEAMQDELQLLNRDNRNIMIQYHNLCKTKKTKVNLMDDPVYDYLPSHYFEVFCEGLSGGNEMKEYSQQKCAYPGFHCVQKSRQLFLSRRRWDSDCWEPYVIEVKSDCTCMWPATSLSDIRDHY